MAKEQKVVAPKAVEQKEAPAAVKVSFEDYLKEVRVHPGLVASFKYEASKVENGLEDRPSEEWETALKAQSNRKYKAFE